MPEHAQDFGSAIDHLLPERHPQIDYSICDVAEAVLKDLVPSMEHPFYALSKKPDMSIRRYEHGPNWVEIIPSAKGQATIYDKDILIYAVSQIMNKLNRGDRVDRVLRFNPRDLLIFVNRGTGGKDYDAFCEALDRLMGTVIKTNITTRANGGDMPLSEEEARGWFHLVERATVVRKGDEETGRIMHAEIQLSEWVFNSIRRKSVLTLHRDYFRLRKPIERRVYEIARKLCGAQPRWQIGLEKLLMRTGARSELKRFRHTMKEMAQSDHLPDYHVAYDDESDMVVFRNRGTVTPEMESPALPPLSEAVRDEARGILPGADIAVVEREWRDWITEAPRDSAAAFLGFCRNRQDRLI
ncbi:replication initiator protein A [Limimaricola hongkongensis]|uniref:RepA n=1 Tax=Limimaricola hongkongensis DSM 17492 TaxID=1122180 RepID=A0A017H8F6_9RHOB|nr:replication initiator protein A [Limimaricola hongkongensis]EYD70570.1 RepA [Limimaricola hongkongensis DSM 17492]